MNKLLSLFFLLLCLLSCNEKEVDTKAEAEKLMQTSREWVKAVAIGDTEKAMSYWREDAVYISNSEGTLIGKNAIRQMVEGSKNIPGFKISWEPTSAVISKSGDMGYLLEDSQISMHDSTGKPMTIFFQSVTIWKKDKDGAWRNAVDVMSPKKAVQ
jgi:ketosteroid isomerase-like protein